MKYEISKIVKDDNGELIRVAVFIRLDDSCKNGHNDFSITGHLFEKSEKGRFKLSACGCLHDLIVKYFPEFQIFVDLHLSDDNGVPMYPIANNPYTRFFAVEDSKPLIDSIVDALPSLKEKAKKAIDMLCEMTGEQYTQSAYSAHLYNETKKAY